MTTPQFLDRPGGRLAYELTGDPDGPLVLLSPGMGDLRSTFDGLAAQLAADGARVVNADLRGHGESSTGWDDYSVSAVADDLIALLRAHGGRGVLVGNSYSGSAAVIAAARAPEAVSGLVLAGAFVRDGESSALQKALFALFHRTFPGRPLWTAVAWPSFFKRRPANYAARKAELAANLKRPHGYDALARMTTDEGTHRHTEPMLGRVKAPALVIMGSKDPDFPDPAAEARFTADSLGGPAEVQMIEGVGHYPQTEALTEVAPAVAAFVAKLA
jgi:pimeloyl-ACP methyl ester carboxylesterase